MKAKTIKVNQKKTHKTRNRCSNSYLSNSPHCNKVFAVVFIMFIAGMFITSILMAIVKARWIDLPRPFYTVYADNIGNASHLDVNGISSYENSITTEAVNVERFLENLNEVYDSHIIESTTEMSAVYLNDEDPLTMARSKKSDVNYSAEDDDDENDSDNLKNAELDEVTPIETTTAAVSITKPCSITDIKRQQCEITCSNIGLDGLSSALIDIINDELKNNPNCSNDNIYLKLKNINFSDFDESLPWIRDTRVYVTELTINESPTFYKISENSFDTSEFEEMTNFMIYGTGTCDLKMECEQCFNGASNLKVLTISNFKSISIPDGALVRFKDTLTDLEVSKIGTSWNIKNLLNTSELSKIEKLMIQQNFFDESVFIDHTFDPVKENVKRIYLASSNVKILSNDTFSGCKKLEYLDLKSNQIENLPAGIFDDLEMLKTLEIQNNTLKTIPSGLFDTQLRFSRLTSINLNSNHWNCDFDILYLKFFLNLVTTDDLKCKTPPKHENKSIKNLWCSVDGCNLKCEETNDAELKVALEIYNMSNCNQIELELTLHVFDVNVIPLNWLSFFNYNLHKLTINDSLIEVINNGAFHASIFDQLHTLSIKGNKAQSFVIGSGGLSGLNSMEVLKIEESNVLTLPGTHNILQPIQNNLKEVSIMNIRDSFKPREIFESVTFGNLKILRLSGNNFESVSFNSTSFNGVHESVEELYMENSKVNRISFDTFADFKSLKAINLNENNLTSVEGRFFGDSGDKKLISINLSSSGIVKLNENSFKGCKELKYLDLSSNFIVELPPGIFDDLENLITLNLQNNTLETIPENLFHTQLTFETLTLLNLKDNLWKCDENIVPLKQFLMETNSDVSIDGCEKPDELFRRNIKDLWCNSDSCKLTCERTNENVLVPVLNIFDMSTCSEIDVELTYHTFDNRAILKNWLSGLNFKIHALLIEDTHIGTIADGSFNSKTFEDLKELVIRRSEHSSLYINPDGLLGLDSIETLILDDLEKLDTITSYSILAPIKKAVKYIAITNVTKIFDLNKIFGRNSDIFENIQTLHLSKNNFEELDFNTSTFIGIHDSLREIYLQNSKVTKVSPNAFSEFKKLNLVNLQGNELTTLDPQFFGDVNRDLKIFISQNPWNCTCSIEFLLEFITDQTDVECHYPEDTVIFELEELCKDSTTISTTTTEEETTTSEETTTKASTTTSQVTTTSTSKEPTELTTTSIGTTSNDNEPENSTTTLDPDTPKTTNGRSIDPSYTPNTQAPIEISCIDLKESESTTQYPYRSNYDSDFKQFLNSRLQIWINAPEANFFIKGTQSRNELELEFDDYYFEFFPNNKHVLIYYPTNENPFEANADNVTIRCYIISSKTIIVNQLVVDTIYNFCVLKSWPFSFTTPFQCKPHLIPKGRPWLYEDNKAAILTSVSLLIVLALILGIILTYCLIRKIPTIIKGSKRVVLVNNRGSSDVMILPRSSTQSISSSIRKESVTPVMNEPPTYLTPLPRQSFDQRPPFVRSSSDTSLKSYVSVSRLPPRFSQVYQRDDFENCAAPRNNGGYPCYAPTAPCQPSSEIPPPLPRRSIVSTASSTQHSSCASTAELGRTMSRTCNHNSTYRRQPRTREIEQENHYNVII